jgi:PIN domain nuclease of toxin-antitoxin system
MTDHLYIIDTHALIWYLTDDKRLGKSASRILDDSETRLLIPSIVLAEAIFILERKPGLYSLSEATLLQEIEQDPRMEVVALDRDVLIKTLECKTIFEMHDRQIVATALLVLDAGFDIAILTQDGNITDSAVIPVIW